MCYYIFKFQKNFYKIDVEFSVFGKSQIKYNSRYKIETLIDKMCFRR